MTLMFVIQMRSFGPQPFCLVVCIIRPKDYNVYFEKERVRKDAFSFQTGEIAVHL